MRVKFELMGQKLMIEAQLGYVYVGTSGHEFFYHRDWWFEGRNGKDRHWSWDRKMKPQPAALTL